IAHRRESDSKLSVIENYGVRVEKLSYPFELYSLVNKERVSRIHCFYSSVLTNFLELDDDVIGNSYIIGPEFINSKFREFVSSVYSNYQSQKHPRLELFSIRDDE
ncbi:hypothetical protein, partial [Salinivibrio sp. MA607]|uniref:hypothetical protein n=1 Tax=Salinivibrio sp. MA607 TaxID=1909457 RepID=UPI001A7E08C1